MTIKNKNNSKIFNTKELKKNWETNVIISLIVVSAFATGMYYSNLNFTNQLNNDKISAQDTETGTGNTRQERILSQMMDETVGACYYDAYQQNESQPSTGDVCNKIMVFNKQICKTMTLESCNSEFLKKYLRGMEG